MTAEESADFRAAAAAVAAVAVAAAAAAAAVAAEAVAPEVVAIALPPGWATAKTAALTTTLALPPSYPSLGTHRFYNLHGLSNSYPNSTIIIKRLPTSFDDPFVTRAILSISPCLCEVGRARAHARVSLFPSDLFVSLIDKFVVNDLT